MAGALHTYGVTCRLGERSNPFMRRASVVSDEAPKLRAQYFYSSLLPIDDPLSPVPTTNAPNRLLPRPFSSYDNEQLEREWLGLEGETVNASFPVGFNRLHTVEMPELEMRPIYWSPVHDVSPVVRATWFYKDLMTPVPPDIANMLESGYQYIKPWTQTYDDEVTSCLNVGPEAELRLVHGLFSGKRESRPGTAASMTSKVAETIAETEGEPEVESFLPEISYSDRAAGKLDAASWAPQIKYRSTDSVIYANAKEAQILRPHQIPSVKSKRKPLADIRKGKEVGISVVRGFDAKAWLSKQPLSKLQQIASREFQRQRARAETATSKRRSVRGAKGTTVEPTAGQPGVTRAPTGVSESAIEFNDICEACLAEERKPETSDLVLVIHGIGQKLSEKVETYHFTHSINSVRRQFAIELEESQIRNIVRPGLSNVMVLPVNWRSKLEFGDDGRREDTGVASLKDITPDTIPSVRSLVSDVLLDIPYYMSHHKPKMIEAVVGEANRIYRLWCRNNPGFQQSGRVHIIAHSLGSVMALDILSAQPTRMPKEVDFDSVPSSLTHFDFDTTNLFFAGSPASLFLLLNHARLRPRRDRNKPGADKIDYDNEEVVGEQGMYGCLAVDNIYNVMHYNDPVAYKLNATVDTLYSSSLQDAAVPSSAASWSQAFNNLLFRTNTRSHTSLAKARTIEQLSAAAVADLRSRGQTIPTMPVRNVEMETHDFNAEKIAEKKMYLLNDNGQLDWYISSGGTIEFQYLDMLGAHSSYWTLQDFVRFVLVEVGRTPGRDDVIASIKATKKRSKRDK